MSLMTNYNPSAVLELQSVEEELRDNEGCSIEEYMDMLSEEADSWERDIYDMWGHDTRIEQVMYANAVNELHYLQDLKRRVKKELANG